MGGFFGGSWGAPALGQTADHWETWAKLAVTGSKCKSRPCAEWDRARKAEASYSNGYYSS